ncbi:MAG: ABC transporter permease [Clostridia bacterium]|nr:ABC transporter permease [Clostridia bacterium]
MKNGAFVVFRKEMARFLGDRRLFFTTVILPGLLIFIMYNIMGNVMADTIGSKLTAETNVYAVNIPKGVKNLVESGAFNVTVISEDEIENAKKEIEEKNITLCIVFPKDFENSVNNFNPNLRKQTVPNVEIYYSSADMASSAAYSRIVDILDVYESAVSNVFDVNFAANSQDQEKYDIATNEQTTGTLFASLLPMMLMTLMYSSCMALAPESIAGEKERGTFATLLITPVPREQIALGKVLALSCMALLSGLSNFLGTVLSMPALMSSVMETSDTSISVAVYTPKDFGLLILVILSTVIMYVTVISVLSTIAKTVKEASTLTLPFMMAVMFIGFSALYSTDAKNEIVWYLIPAYNSVQSMIGIFSFNAVTVNILVTAGVNLAVSAVGMVLLRALFNNERVMFAR